MTAAYRFGRFELNPATRELLVDGQPLALGARAFDLLLALIERRERLVTKDELLELAWPGVVVEESNIQVQVSSLRKILGEEVIKTVPGRGYRFTAEVAQLATRGSAELERHNLPRPLTRFIGHEVDLDEYSSIIATNRLVTLTGIGGCGKTRLAIEVARRVLLRFAHGAWFVDLAPMADAERLPSTVAKALGVNERPGESIVERLCECLAGWQILLVLDNCEHLVDPCAALVQTMLDRAKDLTILATSRETLGVPGECTLKVRSLTCPNPGQRELGDRIQTSEAMELFVDRARLVQPDFALNGTTAPPVAEICRRLDGIPLAIELAAARTKVLSVDELRQRLDDRFVLLVGGSRTALPRQQTLLATIKWSFDLLPPDERQLLERLCVFAGGWTLDGAVAVAGDGAGQYEVLELLTNLVDKSLIAANRPEEAATRYSVLETVRQYGLETLAGSGAETTTAKRYIEYFVALVERLEPGIKVEDKEALEQLAPELDNLVLGLRWCERVPGASNLGLRLVAGLSQYWLALGVLDLGYRLTTQALSRSDEDATSSARARALLVATRFAGFLGHYEKARDWGKECLTLARLLQDDHIAAGALVYLGVACRQLGDLEQGKALLEQALDLARQRGDNEQMARALQTIGGMYSDAGNLELASQYFAEGLQIARNERHFHAIAVIASTLACTYLALGQVERVWPLATETLNLPSDAKGKVTMQFVLEMAVRLVAAMEDWPSAARLLGAFDAAKTLVGRKQEYHDEESVAARIRNSLREIDFDVAYKAGYALTLEQVIGEARAWVEKSAPTASGVVIKFRGRFPATVRR